MIELKPGMILCFTRDFTFYLDDKVISSYVEDEQIELLEMTDDNPHQHVEHFSPTPGITVAKLLKNNWRVKSKYGISVWTRVQHLYEHGILDILIV